MTERQIIDQSNDYYKKVELIRRPLLNYARSKIYGSGNAEDIVQNTILILCQKMNDFDPNKSFHGWAFKICNFQMKNYFRKVKRNKEDCVEYINDVCEEHSDSSVEKIISQENFSKRLNNIKLLKSKLSPKQSKVFHHILSGRSRLETRKALGMKESNFNLTYTRIIKNCKKILKNEQKKESIFA